MNPFKIIIPLMLVGAAVAVWQFSPAARSKVRNAFEKYGAWTEEARKEDPVGYMDYAIGKLEGDLEKFGKAKSSLAAAKQEAEKKRAEFDGKHELALELASSLKQTYQTAEAGSGYPVAFQSKDYTREQLVAQVAMTLAERDTYDEAVDDFTAVIGQIDSSATEIATRTTRIKTHITKLKAKREVVKIQQLTAETEELLANVEALIGENDQTIAILPEDEDPVRSLDEFMKAMELEAAATEPTEEDTSESAALEFLEG